MGAEAEGLCRMFRAVDLVVTSPAGERVCAPAGREHAVAMKQITIKKVSIRIFGFILYIPFLQNVTSL
jgi:hypothetical protein